jgi:hypothetical protein
LVERKCRDVLSGTAKSIVAGAANQKSLTKSAASPKRPTEASGSGGVGNNGEREIKEVTQREKDRFAVCCGYTSTRATSSNCLLI